MQAGPEILRSAAREPLLRLADATQRTLGEGKEGYADYKIGMIYVSPWDFGRIVVLRGKRSPQPSPQKG